MQTRSGLLIYTPMRSHSAKDTLAAFTEGLNEFCTTSEGVSEPLMLHILSSVEIIDADGASDAQLALEMLRDSGMFPHVKCKLRDPTHAARRVISRPWAVIEEIKEAFSLVVSNSDSLTNIIQNSDVLGQVFGEYVQKAEGCPLLGTRVRNLSRRGHRFDSYQKPLTRFVMCISAFFETAVWITANRKRNHREHEVATDFLEWVNPSRLVLLGTCADAADESLLLVRHFDRESHDVAELQSATSQYLSRLRYLFVTGGVVRTAGFTELVLQWLRSPHGFMVRGRPKCIGGEHAVDDALIDSCLRPLQVFVRLAAETVKAEYPSYALLSAFQVLSLERWGQSGCRRGVWRRGVHVSSGAVLGLRSGFTPE